MAGHDVSLRQGAERILGRQWLDDGFVGRRLVVGKLQQWLVVRDEQQRRRVFGRWRLVRWWRFFRKLVRQWQHDRSARRIMSASPTRSVPPRPKPTAKSTASSPMPVTAIS